MPMRIPLRETFAAGRTAFGAWGTMPNPGAMRTIAGTPGLSWILIDAEHGQINDTHLYTLSNLLASARRSPIVRLPSAELWQTKRALDAGAHGIMFPLLSSAEEVRRAVEGARYPPVGKRGFGPMYTHHAFGGFGFGNDGNGEGECTMEEYREGAGEVCVLVQIETKDAFEDLEEIAKVEGVDVLFIGPYDLALNLGVVFGSAEHEAAIQRTLAVAHQYGKKAAIYCTDGGQARERALQGFEMVSIATDVDVLAKGFAAHMRIASAAGGGSESEGVGVGE